MSILQWNCRGYRPRYGNLISLLDTHRVLCACLQETLLGDSTPRPPRDYSILCYSPTPRPVPGNGLAILVHSSVAYSRLPLNTTLQALACRVGLHRQYTVCNLYLHPNEHPSLADLRALVAQLPAPFLLLGDINGKHVLWGGAVADPHGLTFEQLLLDRDICLLNDGSATHFHVQTGTSSAIDVSLCSSVVTPDLTWRALDDLHGSDHFPIVIAAGAGEPVARPPRFIFRRADWHLFRTLSAVDGRRTLDMSLDAKVLTFNRVLLQAAELSIPKSSGRPFPRRNPWWTPECSRTKRLCTAALRRFLRTKLLADGISYKRARAVAQFVQLEARRTSWRTYVSSLNVDTPMSQIWSRVAKMGGRYHAHHPPALLSRGSLVTDPQGVADLLADHFASISSAGRYPAAFRHIKARAEAGSLDFSEGDVAGYNSPLTTRELFGALRVSRLTAAGADGISYEMLRRMHPSAVVFLLDIYNHAFLRSSFPSLWREAIILSFPKPNKPPSETSSYRPIALTSCVCKLLEKILNARLVAHLEARSLLHPLQYGFRKHRSAVDALIRLTTDLHAAFARRECTLCVFFDIAKAYDTTWRHGILATVHELGIRGPLALFIKNFLHRRSFCTRVGSVCSDARVQEEGVPQGSVLSCTLFSLAINGIVSRLPPDVRASLYVDDLMIYSSSSHIPALERRIQLAINAVSSWADRRGFTLSEAKTVAVLFRRTRGLAEPDISMHGRRIAFAPSARFLGLLLDQRLTWREHVRALKRSCLQRLGLLRCLSHKSWGADRTTLLRLYRALVRSRLDYGCVLYRSAAEHVLRTLDPIHHEALRICTGAFRSSPTLSLCADSGEPPLCFRRDALTLQYYTHASLLPGSPTYRCIHDAPLAQAAPGSFAFNVSAVLLSVDLRRPLVLPAPVRAVPIWDLPEHLLCRDFSGRKKSSFSTAQLRALFLNHIAEAHSDSLHIFTDGSKDDAGVGCAAVLPHRTQSRRLPMCASIFTAELQAIVDALSLFHENSPGDSAVIFSDSLSALQAIDSYNNRHPLVVAILRWIIRLATRHKSVRLCWVPSHTGVCGNDAADASARAAASAAVAVPDQPLPSRDYYPLFRQKVSESWSQLWTAQVANKLRLLKESIRPWSSASRRSRREEILLCRLRIGHTRLTHGHLMERRPAPYCDDCLVPLTVAHVLSECPSYEDTRLRLFPSLRAVDAVGRLRSILSHRPSCTYNIAPLLALIRNTPLLDQI